MDELEALNMLLKLIGSNVVNDVTTAHPDVANARTTLNRIRKRAQKRGWWFNIDYNVTYQPDPITKEITIPAEITTFVADDTAGVIKRAGKLYNKYDQTYQFDANVTAHRVVRVLEWDDMPESMQEYCAYAAAVEFVRDELEDTEKQRDLAGSAGIALIDVQRDDLEQGQYNTFNKSRVRQARGGVRPYAHNNVRFFGDPDV
mgnify:CR=1 FL=1